MHTSVQTFRGVQQRLLDPSPPAIPILHTARGAVFTRRWVVELLLDLAGYVPSANLIDTCAIEPACGDGAFLAPMIERLLASCAAHGRSATDCQDSIRAFELDAQSAFVARNAVIDLLVASGVAQTAATIPWLFFLLEDHAGVRRPDASLLSWIILYNGAPCRG